jgi:hypothetical protein
MAGMIRRSLDTPEETRPFIVGWQGFADYAKR